MPDPIVNETTARHTAGPWIADPIDEGTCEDVEVPAGSFWISEHKHAGEVIAVVELNAAANARLIAAAPELLAALEQVEDAVRNAINGEPDIDIEKVRAAIAKAEGRS